MTSTISTGDAIWTGATVLPGPVPDAPSPNAYSIPTLCDVHSVTVGGHAVRPVEVEVFAFVALAAVCSVDDGETGPQTPCCRS